MKKKDKYLTIARTHHFVPVVVETSGAFGPDALQLFADIARRIRAVTREIKSRAYLFQRVSVDYSRETQQRFWVRHGWTFLTNLFLFCFLIFFFVY